MALQIDIVTPHGNVYSGTADEVTVPGVLGEMGLLPGHIPVMSALKVGELVARNDTKKQFFAVEGGFVEIARDRVSVITERAMRPEEIDLEIVARDREQALADMRKAESRGSAAVESANQALIRAETLGEIARKHGHR